MIHLDRSLVAGDGKDADPPRPLSAALSPLRGAITLSFAIANERKVRSRRTTRPVGWFVGSCWERSRRGASSSS
jgi:hypothetical protein